ncbi:MAG: DNA-directed RNA polymerase subunit beta' [Candidatus Bipolaricaulota bacterium]|nr:MAG: DNA-directed RNA polymerase subunit beta' [Candidatus Bipolaricaulota bacterium]
MISGDDIKRVKLQLASPSTMVGWSHGEVTESETINYRTHRAERGGLYAEEIFGPENDYECGCGKYKGKKYEGITCEKCHVLVTDSSVRRVNMAHISLASPVIHFWFLKGVSSLLSRLLGMKKKELQRIAYYETEPIEASLWVVTSSENKEVRPGETLYAPEVDILSGSFNFTVEPAFFVADAPAVIAEEGGRVTIEDRRLTSGEKIRAVVVGSQEYPIAGEVELNVEDGDKIEAQAMIAERPVEDVCAKTTFEMLVDRYGADVSGEVLDSEILDSLVFLITRVRNPETGLKLGERINYLEKRAYERVYPNGFVALTGAAGVKGLLESLDLDDVHDELTESLRRETAVGNQRRLIRRLEVVDQLRSSGNNAQDMVLDVIPVLPPSLRPMIQLEGGKFATTDLNDLYRRIINRNNRLKKLIDMGAPEVILRNERRMLQEAVDALIHNEKKENPIRGRDNRPLKSLSERIHGKHGRLRRNLLGRRVDYSGRAVIVVDPSLRLNQCGLPKKMALELFKPFILHYLETTTFSDFDEIKNRALRGEMPEVWDILEKLISKHPVLLNRAPTLHRLSMQAFEPVLVDGEAIHIHPLVCPPYNADFDGDQMAVHLPLSAEAIEEARSLMAAPRNILSPSSGEPLSLPTQDPVFAYYYLTLLDEEGEGSGKAFRDLDEARRAHEEGFLALHSPVRIRIDGDVVETTLGRAELNAVVPAEIRDYDTVMDRRAIRRLVMECYHRFGWERASALLDSLKDLGFRYATRAGLTISLPDCLIPEEKEEIIRESYSAVRRINRMHEMGLATDEERRLAVIRIWRRTVDQMEDATMDNLRAHKFNPVYGMVTSGARGGPDQVKQLCGMRGPMAGQSGEIIEMPVISNFREGLDMMEYFISTHGGRKGAADTALKTADSGYLTRRLVDAASDTIVKEVDCGTMQGVSIDPLRYGKLDVMESIEERIYGRVLSQAVVDPDSGDVVAESGTWVSKELADRLAAMEATIPLKRRNVAQVLAGTKSVGDVVDPSSGHVIVQQDEVLTSRLVDALRKAKVAEISVRPQIMLRSPMVCESINGVCQLCYGFDMSNHQAVELGTAVGVIAAQSVGEPGTQLTMRTCHTGGVAGEDITQGLPRAEELFEARKTIKSAEAGMSPLDGHVEQVSPLGDTGRDLVEILGEVRQVSIPTALCRAKKGEDMSGDDLLEVRSPCAGELYLLEGDGKRELVIIDTAAGDRSYPLPPGAVPVVRNGQRVAEGDALTERFHLEPRIADRAGKIVVPEGKDRGFVLVGTDSEEREYEIPYGARMMVEHGAKVSVGDQLTSRSKPTFLAAEGEGKVLKLADRVLVYNPEGRLLRFPLTSDLLCDKGHGERVRENERLVHLELPPGDLFHVEKVKEEDDVTLVDLRPRCSVEIDQMATVRAGDKVKEGDLLTKGVVAPHALLETAGVRKTREYLLTEIHKVYKAQGVDINDKHLEVIIRQILNNVRIVDRGDSHFLIGDLVMLEEFQEAVRSLSQWNQEAEQGRRAAIGEVIAEDVVAEGELIAPSGERLTDEIITSATRVGVSSVWIRQTEGQVEIQLQDKRLPVGERELLRISKAALQTKGWLSAASFQRTTKVLAEAALRGEVDELEGLKPNIIVGKRIPAGTGFPSRPVVGEEADEEIDDEGAEADSEAQLTGSTTDL